MATWVGYPRSYTEGRTRPVQYVVIHATHGSEGPTSAEDGHAYNLRRTDGTSTHIFVDSDSAVREVPDGDRAHHARYHGNEIGLGVEICGRADQTADQWDDPVSRSTLVITAREVAQMCRDHQIPVRRLTVAETRAAYYAAEGQRPKGIVAHYDVTRAYPEDEGTHWDPGPGFPWPRFLGMVAEQMGEDMPTAQEIADAVWAKQVTAYTDDKSAGKALWSARQHAMAANQRLAGQAPVPALEAAAATLAQVLAEVSDDPATPSTITPEDRAAIAERVVAAFAGALAG